MVLSETLDQVLSYDASTHQIKLGDFCVDYNPSNGDVYLNSCNVKPNQIWYYDSDSLGLKTLHDNKCLDWHNEGNRLYMGNCGNEENKKFFIPPLWSPSIDSSAFDKIHVYSHPERCLDVDPSSNLYTAECGEGNLNQIFYYDATSRQIKHRNKCVDYDSNSTNVYLGECDEDLL